MRQNQYDIFWGHLGTGNAYARIGAALGGGKSVATLHSEGYASNAPKRWRDRVAVGFEGSMLGGTTARVAVSNAVARDFETYFHLSDIAVAYNGIDVEKVIAFSNKEARGEARARWGIGTDSFFIVNAARYVTKKGQRYLVDAIHILSQRGISDIKLLLCGGGDPTALRQQATALGLSDRVICHDVLEQAELMPLIAAADAFVMPSLREPFGIAAGEAMALGVPTILTEVDGFIELEGGTNSALMSPAADGQSLANCILELRADPERAQAMGRRAAARIAEHFSIDACARRWIEIFDAVQIGKAIPPCAE